MAESEVVKVAREYREALARNEDSALRDMARHWASVESDLVKMMELVEREIEDYQKAGNPIPPQVIEDQERYKDLLAQIQDLIPKYEQGALDTIVDYQKESFILGLDGANAELRAALKSSPIWNQVSRESVEIMAGFTSNGAPLQMLIKNDFGAMSNKIIDAMVSGIALGKGSRATAEDMANVVTGDVYKRMLRIARTETNRAYRYAAAQQYQKSRVVKKVLRLCYPPTACAACLAMDGEECPGGMVQDHPNGKCTSVVVTVGGNMPTWEHGTDWFEHQTDVDKRRILGEGHFELYKDGVSLRDMVMMQENPVWGGSPSLIPLKELTELRELGAI